jgi:hypothetical protein
VPEYEPTSLLPAVPPIGLMSLMSRSMLTETLVMYWLMSVPPSVNVRDVAAAERHYPTLSNEDRAGASAAALEKFCGASD